MRRWLWIGASYLVVFAVLAAPWLRHATHALPIDSTYARADTRLLTWILWWVERSLLHGPMGILDAPINYPAPAQLTGSEHFATLQLVFLPLYATTGNAVLAMNAILFLSYPLAALAMNRLLRALDFAPGVAWVAGLGFALGALQVPARVHMLHTLAFYLPTAALALHRLRERTDARRAGILAAVVLAAFFTAYYTAAILLLTLGAWLLGELARPLPGRRRFVLATAAVVLACLAPLAVASLPYLSRGATVDGALQAERLRDMHAVITASLTIAPQSTFGLVALALGAAGCLALREPRWRVLALVALALVATGVALATGGALRLAEAVPAAGALTSALAFFRVVQRYVAVAGFGLALLGALALQQARERWSPDAANVLLLAIAACLTLERGRLLLGQELDTPRALTVEAPVYRAVARIVARQGSGPLLELPISSFGYSLQPEAMLGEMQHRQPLIVGHTGYLPPHRPLVDEAIARLPADAALQNLVDMTHLRWLLVRPIGDWGRAEVRDRFLFELTAVPGVRRVREIGGWTLLEIARLPVNDDRFAAIAQRPRAVTIAGSPPQRRTIDLADARAALPAAVRVARVAMP